MQCDQHMSSRYPYLLHTVPRMFLPRFWKARSSQTLIHSLTRPSIDAIHSINQYPRRRLRHSYKPSFRHEASIQRITCASVVVIITLHMKAIKFPIAERRSECTPKVRRCQSSPTPTTDGLEMLTVEIVSDPSFSSEERTLVVRTMSQMKESPFSHRATSICGRPPPSMSVTQSPSSIRCK